MKFPGTPCEPGKPYEGPATHTREIMLDLGYDDHAIGELAKRKAIALEAGEIVPIPL